MRIIALLSGGIVIYALMFLLWSGLTLYGYSGSAFARILSLVILVAVALLAGRMLRFHSWRDIIPYSIMWTVTVAVLDVIFTVPFTSWGLFTDWNIWLGYSLILVVPLLAPRLRRNPLLSGTRDGHDT